MCLPVRSRVNVGGGAPWAWHVCLARCAAAVGGPLHIVALRLLHWTRWEAVPDALRAFFFARRFRAVVVRLLELCSLSVLVPACPTALFPDSLLAMYCLFLVASWLTFPAAFAPAFNPMFAAHLCTLQKMRCARTP